MTTSLPRQREKFDPDRQFRAIRGFPFLDATYGPGDIFPREVTTTRKLRQLYEARYLVMDPLSVKPNQSILDYLNDHGGTELSLMSIDELKAWLVEHGVVPRYGASRVQLLERAEVVLEKSEPLQEG